MKRVLSFVGLLTVGCVLTGCDYNRPKATSQVPANQMFYIQNQSVMAGGNYPLSHFNKVVLSGPVVATLKSDQAQDIVHANGKPSALNKLAVVQRGDVVYISSRSLHPINVDIESQGSQIPLSLSLSGKSQTNMEGNYLIQQIDASGRSKLNLYWLNTSHLTINAKDSAKLFLAGVVTHLDITASDSAEVNGKYLRAQDSYVLATGNSSVGVNTQKVLGTQALGNASVYYYKHPESRQIYLGNSGSALNMVGLSGPSNDLLN